MSSYKSMPVVLPSSPQPSPTSPVEPLDLRDIGDLPVKLELRYAIESRRNEKGLDIPPTMAQPKKLRLQVPIHLFYTGCLYYHDDYHSQFVHIHLTVNNIFQIIYRYSWPFARK